MRNLKQSRKASWKSVQGDPQSGTCALRQQKGQGLQECEEMWFRALRAGLCSRRREDGREVKAGPRTVGLALRNLPVSVLRCQKWPAHWPARQVNSAENTGLLVYKR